MKKTMGHQCVKWTETAYNNVNTVISEYLGSTAGDNLYQFTTSYQTRCRGDGMDMQMAYMMTIIITFIATAKNKKGS